MNLELWNLKAFIAGIVSGGVCVSGLFYGVRSLMNATRDDMALETHQKSRLRFYGGMLVLGQFIVAFAVVGYYLATTPDKAVVPLAYGLVGSIIIGNLFFATLRK